MSYGPKREDNYQAGMYAVHIIKGDRPADLPVVRPSKFNLVIDVTTAKLLGFDIPPALLARADEVLNSDAVCCAVAEIRSDKPVPRLSKQIRRENEASRSRKALQRGSSQT